jgi:nucleoside-diphosphate-sugar epimerase
MDRLRVLITGGNGYIAKSLYNALKEEHDITLITRDSFDLTDHAATNDFFRNRYFEVVIHTAVAGGSRLKVDDTCVLDYNLMMYYNLLAQRSHYGKFIHFGSGAELHMPNEYYGMSKKIIANSMTNKEGFYNLKVFGVFDENELDTRFIKASILNYIARKPINIHHDKKMTFFYMKDLVTLVNHYIKSDPKALRSVCWCSYVGDCSLVEIADYINELGDHKVNILVGREPAPHDYISDYNAGYGLPYIGLKKGIQEVYDNILHSIS